MSLTSAASSSFTAKQPSLPRSLRYANFAVLEAFPLTACAVLRNEAALLLHQRRHYGYQQFDLAVERPDAPFLGVALSPLDLADSLERVDLVVSICKLSFG
jgi:hypothetical protein